MSRTARGLLVGALMAAVVAGLLCARSCAAGKDPAVVPSEERRGARWSVEARARRLSRPPESVSAAPERIDIYVVDAESGAVLPDAVLSVRDCDTGGEEPVHGTAGRFAVPRSDKTSVFCANAQGHVSETKRIERATESVTFQLLRTPSLEVSIIDGDSASPVVGATVTCRGHEPQLELRAEPAASSQRGVEAACSDDVGIVRFSRRETGPWVTVECAPAGFARERRVCGPHDRTCEIRLRRARRIAVVAHDCDGRAAKGAEVQILGPDAAVLATANAGEDGRCQLAVAESDIVGGSIHLRALRDDLGSVSRTFAVPSAGCELSLRFGRTVSGSVRFTHNGDGLGLADVVVGRLNDDSSAQACRKIASLRTAPDGTLHLDRVERGTGYAFLVGGPGWILGMALATGEELEGGCVREILASRRVEVRAVGPDGVPIASAKLRVGCAASATVMEDDRRSALVDASAEFLDGSASFWIPPDSTRVFGDVSAPGLTVRHFSARVTTDPVVLTIRLESEFLVDIVVRDERGNVVSNAAVSVACDEGERVVASTNAEGEASLTLEGAGPVQVTVYASDGACYSRRFSRTEVDGHRIEVTLPSLRRVRVRISDASGAGIAGAGAMARVGGLCGSGRSRASDADGWTYLEVPDVGAHGEAPVEVTGLGAAEGTASRPVRDLVDGSELIMRRRAVSSARVVVEGVECSYSWAFVDLGLGGIVLRRGVADPGAEARLDGEVGSVQLGFAVECFETVPHVVPIQERTAGEITSIILPDLIEIELGNKLDTPVVFWIAERNGSSTPLTTRRLPMAAQTTVRAVTGAALKLRCWDQRGHLYTKGLVLDSPLRVLATASGLIVESR